MTAPPLILSIIHYTACSISLVFGVILLILLIFHTPNQLRSFAVLLRTQVQPNCQLTMVELSTSLAAALIFPRVIPLGVDAAAVVINGPIKLVTSNISISWIFYTIELHGTLQYNVFMSVCYCYRYYVLRWSPPSIFAIRLFACLIFTISFALYVLFACSRASPAELIVYINRFVNQYDMDIRETFGVVNVLRSLATPAIVWTVLTACVLSVVNVFVGTAIYRYLKYHSAHINERTRAHHKQFFVSLRRSVIERVYEMKRRLPEFRTALTLQALFGQLLLLSAGGYALEQLNLIRSPFLEYGTHMISEIAIATSPVITLIFVKPYRRAIISGFRKHKIGVITTTTTRSARSQ